MSYNKEFANKTTHFDIIKNPDVHEFLKNCHIIKNGEEFDKASILKKFVNIPSCNLIKPENIIAIDGSYHESSVTDGFPSQKVGYIKIGSILLKHKELVNLQNETGTISPMEIAKFKNNSSSITITLPTTYLQYKDCADLQEGFRLSMEESFLTICEENHQELSLYNMLLKLISYLDKNSPEEMSKNGGVMLQKCPSCEFLDVIAKTSSSSSPIVSLCPKCQRRLFITDILRIWEKLEGISTNEGALSRAMNIIERIVSFNYIRSIIELDKQNYVNSLSNLCIFIDGPLAVFGEPAKFHSSFMKYLNEINVEMRKAGKSDILMIGIQKTGPINDFFGLFKNEIPNGKIFCIDDDFRYKYIKLEKKPTICFGMETYYGQDFVYKNKKGSIIVFSIPYPWDSKGISNFKSKKEDIKNYKNLKVYTDLLDDFDCDLYENSLIPTVLAHKYTAISLKPGSKILDLLSRNSIY